MCLNAGIAPGEQVAYAEGVAQRKVGVVLKLQEMSYSQLWLMIE